MKKRALWIIPTCLGIILTQSNPKYKTPYVKHMAQNVQTFCCKSSSTIVTEPCKRLWPITTPVLQGILYLYTKSPRNYIVFTWYTTRLPGYTVHGVGVGGQFWVLAESSKAKTVCDVLYTTEAPRFQFNFTRLK